MNTSDDKDHVAKWMQAIRRNSLLAGFIFFGIVLIGFSTVTDSVSNLTSACRSLFGKKQAPHSLSAGSIREFKQGDIKDIRWFVERLIRDGSVEGYVWGDYQIGMTMNVDTSTLNRLVITGLMTNAKGPQFSRPDSYSLSYEITPTDITTQISLIGPGIPGAGMKDVKISEATYYQEKWDEVRLLFVAELDNNMTARQTAQPVPPVQPRSGAH